MNARASEIPTSGEADPILVQLVDELADRLQAGEPVDWEDVGRRHPGRVEQVRRMLPAIAAMAEFGGVTGQSRARSDGPGPGAAEAVGVLGDYRILREIGRGGMGVVYEAVQLSLNRRVALKVLPFAAVTDPKQLQRFHVEAQAAAQLHHTNIVPVHAVGCERGVHYYAMQYIEGESLAGVIAELRRIQRPKPEAPSSSTNPASALASGLSSGPLDTTEDGPDAAEPTGPGGDASSPSGEPPAPKRTPEPPSGGSTRSRAFFRNAAQLGVQAAEALEHAHAQGVLHRDIKPANLMIDMKGNLWVTDFGLARLLSEASLTMTGDLLGTLRYMSPEQALAKRVVIDHRTDIYSLGATLYELLTLHSVFEGTDRQELLRQIAFTDPPPLRYWNPAVPRELETIVVKALDKEPASRFASAQDLADDLQRYLEGKPIQARPPTLSYRLAKFVRRHTAAVTATILLLAMTVLGMAIGIISIENERARTARERDLLRRKDYIHKVNLAYRDCQGGDVGQAERLLDECPPDLRGWEWNYVKRFCHLDLRTYTTTRPVHAVAFSPDGRRLASGGGELTAIATTAGTGELVIRDADTGRVDFAHHDLESGILALAFSPDGQFLLTGGGLNPAHGPPGGDLILWDARTGKRVFHQGDPQRSVLSVAFSPDGKRFAAGYGQFDESSGPGELRLFDTVTRKELARPLNQSHGIASVAFSPDGTLIATGATGTVDLWDAKTLKGVQHILAPPNLVFAVAFSADGQSLASAHWDQTVRLWDVSSGREVRILDGHDGFARAVAFTPDRQSLAVAGEDGTVTMWEIHSGREIAKYRGHTLPALSVAFHPGGTQLVSGSWDRSVKVWDVAGSRPLIFRGHHAWVNGVAFSPDGTLIVSGSGRVGLDDTLKLWNSRSGELLQTFSGHAGPVYYVAFGRGGRLVLSADRKRTVKVWDTLDKHELISLSFEAPYHVLNWIAFRPDGEQFAVGCPDNTIQIRQAQTGQLIRVLRGHATPALEVSYSPDGHRLVSFSTSVDLKTNEFQSGGEVKLWDPDLGHDLSTPCRNIKSGMVWTDGKRVALSRPRTEFKFHTPTDVILMDAMTGRELFTLRGHTAFVSDLAFSPDGKRIATCGDERAIKLWDAETGEEVFTLRGHGSGVRALRFSPDGLRLVSGGIDWTARVWDATPLAAEAATDAAAKSARPRD